MVYFYFLIQQRINGWLSVANYIQNITKPCSLKITNILYGKGKNNIKKCDRFRTRKGGGGGGRLAKFHCFYRIKILGKQFLRQSSVSDKIQLNILKINKTPLKYSAFPRTLTKKNAKLWQKHIENNLLAIRSQRLTFKNFIE